jgi:transposase InsO family protein
VKLYRHYDRGLMETAFGLFITPGRLRDWNQEFDKNLKAYVTPRNQRKKIKVTADIVRKVVESANAWKKKKNRIVLKEFTRHLARDCGIDLNKNTVSDILVANGLRKIKTQKKRPAFYQSLCQVIPNGLLSIDGSEFSLFLDDDPYKFNVESAVDVLSNLCGAASVSDTETSEEVLKVLEAHRRKWGTPLGMLVDHGSANLSDDVRAWLEKYDVELVAAGPANPKGNGVIEGWFGWLKRVIGTVRIDMSSKRAMAKSILEVIVNIYIHMQSRLPSGAGPQSRLSVMGTPVDPKVREIEKERLRDYLRSKEKSNDDPKLNILCGMVRHLNINPDIKAFKRAEKTIIHYDIDAIRKSETIFVKAVSRKPQRLSLAYFFGILKRIQQERDDQAYADYCRQKYHYDQMIETERLEQERLENEKPPRIELIIDMLIKSVTIKQRSIQELAMRRVVEWTDQLKKTVKYVGPLRKKFTNIIAELKNISLDQKMEIQRQVEILLPV